MMNIQMKCKRLCIINKYIIGMHLLMMLQKSFQNTICPSAETYIDNNGKCRQNIDFLYSKPLPVILISRAFSDSNITQFGMDLLAQENMPVRAAHAGTVILAGTSLDYFDYVIIKDTNQSLQATVYANIQRSSKFQVDVLSYSSFLALNVTVNSGDVIGYILPNAKGYNDLYFEVLVRENSERINSLGQNGELQSFSVIMNSIGSINRVDPLLYLEAQFSNDYVIVGEHSCRFNYLCPILAQSGFGFPCNDNVNEYNHQIQNTQIPESFICNFKFQEQICTNANSLQSLSDNIVGVKNILVDNAIQTDRNLAQNRAVYYNTYHIRKDNENATDKDTYQAQIQQIILEANNEINVNKVANDSRRNLIDQTQSDYKNVMQFLKYYYTQALQYYSSTVQQWGCKDPQFVCAAIQMLSALNQQKNQLSAILSMQGSQQDEATLNTKQIISDLINMLTTGTQQAQKTMQIGTDCTLDNQFFSQAMSYGLPFLAINGETALNLNLNWLNQSIWKICNYNKLISLLQNLDVKNHADLTQMNLIYPLASQINIQGLLNGIGQAQAQGQYKCDQLTETMWDSDMSQDESNMIQSYFGTCSQNRISQQTTKYEIQFNVSADYTLGQSQYLIKNLQASRSQCYAFLLTIQSKINCMASKSPQYSSQFISRHQFYLQGSVCDGLNNACAAYLTNFQFASIFDSEDKVVYIGKIFSYIGALENYILQSQQTKSNKSIVAEQTIQGIVQQLYLLVKSQQKQTIIDGIPKNWLCANFLSLQNGGININTVSNPYVSAKNENQNKNSNDNVQTSLYSSFGFDMSQVVSNIEQQQTLFQFSNDPAKVDPQPEQISTLYAYPPVTSGMQNLTLMLIGILAVIFTLCILGIVFRLICKYHQKIVQTIGVDANSSASKRLMLSNHTQSNNKDNTAMTVETNILKQDTIIKVDNAATDKNNQQSFEQILMPEHQIQNQKIQLNK